MKLNKFVFILKVFLYTTTNKIHFDELCLEGKNKKIIFTMCDDNRIEQNWIYDRKV